MSLHTLAFNGTIPLGVSPKLPRFGEVPIRQAPESVVRRALGLCKSGDERLQHGREQQ